MKLNIQEKNAHVKKILLDFIPAFLGVLAALLLNNWQQGSKDRAFINSSIQSIYNDCQENISIIKKQKVHLASHIDTFSFYLNNTETAVYDLVKKNNGIFVEQLRNTGWKIFEKSALVTSVDYEMLTRLYEIDRSINSLNTFGDAFSEKMYSSVNSKTVDDKRILLFQISDMYRSYCNLELNLIKLDSLVLKEYGKIIEKKIL